MCRSVPQNLVQGAGPTGQGGSFGRPTFFWENATRTLVTAPADLEPPKGLGFGLGLGLGLGLGSGLGLG